MRVLVLYRSDAGESGQWAEALAQGLAESGISAAAEDAVDWMPMATGRVDRDVSRRLDRLAKGMDHVHAVGYRAAWACAEAFRMRRPWSVTAYDRPRTTHDALVDRLAFARFVAVPSRAVRRDLDAAHVTGLVRIPPARPVAPVLDRQAARARLGLNPEALVVARWLAPRAEVESDPTARWAEVREFHPEAVLVLAGPGADDPGQLAPVPGVLRLRPSADDLGVVMAAADLAWLPDARQTLWLTALEAHAAGIPCLVDREGSLADLVDDDITGRQAHRDAAQPMIDLLDLPLHRQALGLAARGRLATRGFEDAIEGYCSALEGKS